MNGSFFFGSDRGVPLDRAVLVGCLKFSDLQQFWHSVFNPRRKKETKTGSSYVSPGAEFMCLSLKLIKIKSGKEQERKKKMIRSLSLHLFSGISLIDCHAEGFRRGFSPHSEQGLAAFNFIWM